MPVTTLFPTRLYTAALAPRAGATLNARLKAECLQLREDDGAGRRWSMTGYPGGFTSYSSANRMHEMSPTFAELQKRLNRHVKAFAEALEFDLSHRPLVMTDCWVNIMPYGVSHSLHLHPLATLSGTYYVQVPKKSPGLKFEDPRLDKMMAAPPKLGTAQAANKPWYTIQAQEGHLVLFESWLRHEVTANLAPAERISISFNYNWF